MLRVSEEAQKVRVAQSKLKLLILNFAQENDLTDIELLQSLTEVQGTSLKYMLRTERNPDDPDKGADEE